MELDRFIKYKRDFPVMKPEDSVMAAINMMIERNSGVVLVSDSNNKLVGLFSERDAMVRVLAQQLNPNTTRLAKAMYTEIITRTPDISIEEALQTMVEGRIRHLPIVTKDNEIVGLISLRWLLHDRIRELMDDVEALESYLNDAPGG